MTITRLSAPMAWIFPVVVGWLVEQAVSPASGKSTISGQLPQ
jgi:hypothetical protein